MRKQIFELTELHEICIILCKFYSNYKEFGGEQEPANNESNTYPMIPQSRG